MRSALFASVLVLVAGAASASTVCDDPRLSGSVVSACGTTLVSIDTAAGISFPDKPVVSCEMASRLADFAQAPVLTQPRQVAQIRTTSPQTCEAEPGTSVSIVAFQFPSGWEQRIETAWDNPRRRGYLDNARAAACNRFDSVRSPLSGEEFQASFFLSIGDGEGCN
ncbi:MAG: extensin family protein [Pseudomonadota bacterium]